MSTPTIILPTLTCQRCGYTWVPRIADIRLCARCKSARWNEPRKARASKDLVERPDNGAQR